MNVEELIKKVIEVETEDLEEEISKLKSDLLNEKREYDELHSRFCNVKSRMKKQVFDTLNAVIESDLELPDECREAVKVSLKKSAEEAIYTYLDAEEFGTVI